MSNRQTYPDLTKETARLTAHDWQFLRQLLREFDGMSFGEETPEGLREKLEWHLKDTYDIPDTDDRPMPARNE